MPEKGLIGFKLVWSSSAQPRTERIRLTLRLVIVVQRNNNCRPCANTMPRHLPDKAHDLIALERTWSVS